jgi:hypothetical protein
MYFIIGFLSGVYVSQEHNFPKIKPFLFAIYIQSVGYIENISKNIESKNNENKNNENKNNENNENKND